MAPLRIDKNYNLCYNSTIHIAALVLQCGFLSKEGNGYAV